MSIKTEYRRLKQLEKRKNRIINKIDRAINTSSEKYIHHWKNDIQSIDNEIQNIKEDIGEQHINRLEKKRINNKKFKGFFGSSLRLRRIYKKYKTRKKGGQRYWIK